jgi:hypothetical protein
LWQATSEPGKTLNAVLAERIAGGLPFGGLFVVLTLVSEGALLVVAAQAGFIDGPRVLANMAVDSWLPRRFAALSDRLTTQNGIALMAGAALVTLLYTRGDVRQLVVLYSINVFLTFSLSMLSMLLAWLRERRGRPRFRRRVALFGGGFALCATILAITVVEKFEEGGWLTLVVTGTVVLFCLAVRRHYRKVAAALARLYAQLEQVPGGNANAVAPVDPSAPTACVLVASYGGLGIHTALNVLASFPGHFRNLVFVSIGVIDSGGFKGEDSIDSLTRATEAELARYVELAARLGVPATSRFALGTDAVAEAEKLCLQIAGEFPRATFFAGKVVFERERWYQRLLHNETAFAIQKRLQWAGRTMVILPARVTA